MVDRTVEAIRAKPAWKLTFAWFRETFKVDHGRKDELDWGHAVIDSVALLDQYLWSYGPMIESQWRCIAPQLVSLAPPTRVIDYACGQGLAGLLIDDLTSGDLLGSVRDVLLIEPSSLALSRAEAIYATMLPRSTIKSVSKSFDDLLAADIPVSPTPHTLHVLSNILDVPRFDASMLLDRTLLPGRHTILAVSHHRTFNGGTPRIEQVRSTIASTASAKGRKIAHSEIEQFTCGNPSRSEGVFWLCELEVHSA